MANEKKTPNSNRRELPNKPEYLSSSVILLLIVTTAADEECYGLGSVCLFDH